MGPRGPHPSTGGVGKGDYHLRRPLVPGESLDCQEERRFGRGYYTCVGRPPPGPCPVLCEGQCDLDRRVCDRACCRDGSIA